MNSPFTDFIDEASATFAVSPADGELSNPFIDGFLEFEFTDQMLSEEESPVLSNKNRIDIKKAIAANKYYEKNLWGSNKANIYQYLFNYKIINIPQAMSDENFAFAVAEFQALKKLTIDGKLGTATYAKLKIKAGRAPAPATPLRSRWHMYIKDTVQCPAEPMVSGNETMRHIVSTIRTANAPGHYIYILGWMLDVDFCLMPDDPTTKFKNLLKDAVAKGVEVRALIWGNPLYLKEHVLARNTINGLTSSKGGSARMILDNNTFGSDSVKNAIKQIKSILSGNPEIAKVISIVAGADLNAVLDPIINEGSHHEKFLIVKGSEGMIGISGGIDI